MLPKFYGDQIRWWYGVVVNTSGDPLQLGRALVRIYGIHDDEIPDAELPWASVILPTTEGGVSGIGQNPQLKPGARVIGFFFDGEYSQNPVIWGSIPAIEGAINEAYNVAQASSGNGITTAGNGVPNGNPNGVSPGYPSDLTQGEIERWINEEANLRGIDPNVAIAVFRAEGAGGYQSSVPRSGNGSLNGREASFGPYQMFIGGGMGNEYQRLTGRDLTRDNTREGIRNQIRYALDQAASNGWSAWYGFDAVYGARRGTNQRPTDTSHYRMGLTGAQPVRNWN